MTYAEENKIKKRIFSGIQPTGNIHVGNYLGAIRHWVNSQPVFDNIFCIVDLHAITTPQNPVALRAKILETAGILFAAGIQGKNSGNGGASSCRRHWPVAIGSLSAVTYQRPC